MKALLLPSPKTKMSRFHGKHSWSFPVIYIVLFYLNIDICSNSDEESWPPPRCNTSNNSEGSKYVSNLNAALNILRVYASQRRFNSCEYGQSPDQVYALLQCRQCRGDATVHECYNCSQQAKIDVLQTCGTNIGSRVQEKFCFLRFENYNFIGQVNTLVVKLTNEDSVSSDPDVFLAAVRQLLSNLSSDILSGSAANRFASRSIIDSSRRPIFALAQCWGDYISLDDCKQCFSIAIYNLFTDNSGRLAARALAGSCILQYESKLSSNRAPPPQPQEKSTSKIPLILGVLGGFLLPLIVCSFAIRKRLKNGVFGRPNDGHFMGNESQTEEGEQRNSHGQVLGHIMGNDSQIEEGEQPNSHGQVLGRTLSLSNNFTIFKMETLVVATENFHDNNKLGKGGFGTVYRGTSPEGDEIAVKKLSLQSAQGKKEFLNEVKLVAKVQHRNLVKLLGSCTEGSEKLLVYEYLPNNSLDKILFDPNKRRQLDWQKRYNIILGVTRGLLYLHEDSHLRIIHRDIKAGNILLDGKLKPKIADIGLARLFDEDETHVRTRIAGTRGYTAPEYAMNGQLSVKVDVYSFGILLLEIMSGRKNTDFDLPRETQILLEWAWGLYKGGNIVDMIDPTIIETCSGQEQEQALRCIHVGWLCTQARSSLRPSMFTVNLMLSTEAMVLPEPTEPALVSSVPANSTDNSGSSHTSRTISSFVPSQTPRAPSSIAEASITELEPR